MGENKFLRVIIWDEVCTVPRHILEMFINYLLEQKCQVIWGSLNTLIETLLYGFDDLVPKFCGSYCTDMKNQLKFGVQILNNTDLLHCTDLQ